MAFDQGSAAAHNDSSDVWTSRNLVWGTGFASLLLRRFRCTESGVVWGFTADPVGEPTVLLRLPGWISGVLETLLWGRRNEGTEERRRREVEELGRVGPSQCLGLVDASGHVDVPSGNISWNAVVNKYTV